jgi:uncharacterized membrane protein YbhN (UPF0104 family)
VRRLASSVWLRAAVTITLLALVAARIDWSTAARRLQGGHWGWFLAGVAVTEASILLAGLRWYRLVQGAELDVPAPLVARIYFVASFANTFLPTAIGGDAARTLCIARRGPRLMRALASILADRAAGIAGLVLTSWVAHAAGGSLPGRVSHALTVATAALAGGAAVAVLAVRAGPRLSRLMPRRRRDGGEQLYRQLLRYVRDPVLCVRVVGLSCAAQGLAAAAIVLLARAIDVDLSFALAVASLVIVTVVTMVPVSIGGFGVRESSYVVLLGSAGIGATDATLISLLTVAAFAIASAPGAVVLVHSGLPTAPQAAEPALPRAG